jgi:hypothetical protein
MNTDMINIIIYTSIPVVIFLISIIYFFFALKDDMFKKMFKKKDLPVKEIIKLKKKFGNLKKINIYLYDLKKQKDGALDREDISYIKVAKMINKDLEIKVTDGELVIEKPDYSDPSYKLKMMDVIFAVSNFNYAQFMFRGENKFKLYDMKTEIGDKLKAHALEVIDEVFLDIANKIEEGVSDSLRK